MSDTPKRFEEWLPVDCNECARYWDSSCDGVSKGVQKPCNSFKATRSVVLPEKIKKLENDVSSLRISLLITSSIVLVEILLHLLELE